MNAFINAHPWLAVIGLLVFGAICGVLYILRALGGKFLP